MSDFTTSEGRSRQRADVLARLRVEPLSSLQAREDMGVLHCAARVMELRRAGHRIDTVRSQAFDSRGRRHTVARYVLIPDGEARV
jgi:Helix-turn-helix domain